MLRIADKTFDSHLFTGTGKFASSQLMVEAIRASGSQLVTLAMKRVDLRQHNDAILEPLIAAGVTLLPNTSGAKTAEEAIFAAHLAREALGTNWLKLEIHPDARWLLPDPIETLKAAEMLGSDRHSISQIAWATGFNDSHYFSKAFKQKFGMTPSEYRRRHR